MKELRIHANLCPRGIGAGASSEREIGALITGRTRLLPRDSLYSSLREINPPWFAAAAGPVDCRLPDKGNKLWNAAQWRVPGERQAAAQHLTATVQTSGLQRAGLGVLVLFILPIVSCNAVSSAVSGNDICKCLPLEPETADYRHAAKHVPLPNVTPTEITVTTILSWPQTPFLPPDAPRSGRETQLFHVRTAYLQNASINSADCDIHLEISAGPGRTTPRVVVETPVDSEYCSARQQIQAGLKAHGFILDSQHGGELLQPLPVEVTGLAFEDFEHPQGRGSSEVATLWELHPAIVTLL
jgi:hypothetical protein